MMDEQQSVLSHWPGSRYFAQNRTWRTSLMNSSAPTRVFKVAAAYIVVGWLTMQVGDTLGPALLLAGSTQHWRFS
jgi:hypothetical protein